MSWGVGETKQWTSTITGSTAVGGEPEVTISTPSPDRAGDCIIPSGADVSNFLANPTLTWAHSRDEIPIGTVTHLEIGPKSKIRWRWLTGDPFADRVRRAWEQGVVRASSVEFLPKPGGTRSNNHGGLDYTAWELLGVSLVPTPCNPYAVRTLRALGLSMDGAEPDARTRFEAWLHEPQKTYELPPGVTPFVLREMFRRAWRENLKELARREVEAQLQRQSWRVR